jgi:hypothetical protein
MAHGAWRMAHGAWRMAQKCLNESANMGAILSA